MKEFYLTEANLALDDISFVDEITKESIILSIVYAIIFSLGIIANLVVVFVYLFKDHLNIITNYFFISLAISDIFILIVCIPIIISELFTNEWIFGIVYCKFYYFTEYYVTSVSSFTIITISIERAIAVFHPFRVSKNIFLKQHYLK